MSLATKTVIIPPKGGGNKSITFVLDPATTGTFSNKVPVPADFGGTVYQCTAIATSAPTADITIQIGKNGVGVLAANLTIPSGSTSIVKTTAFAASPESVGADDVFQANCVAGDGATVVTVVLAWR